MENLFTLNTREMCPEYLIKVYYESKMNRKNIEELIEKIGKVDKRYMTAEPNYAHRTNTNTDDELLYEVVTREVLFEKVGNCKKGIITGLHKDYGDLRLQRTKYKDENDVFNMWVRGDIQGSVVVKQEGGTFPINVLTNERFFGCSYPWINSEEKWKEFTKDF